MGVAQLFTQWKVYLKSISSRPVVDIACMSINELDAEAWSWLILPKKLSSIVLVLLVLLVLLLLDVAVFDKNTLFLRKFKSL